MSILAHAAAGRIETCVRGAEFLLNMYRTQPQPDKRFFSGWIVPEGLLTQPDDSARTTVLEWSGPKQHYYKAGLFVVALARAYGATGDGRYLDAAIGLYGDVINRAEDLWTNTISHKMCWAATTLFHITGETDYREHACRFADHLVSVQQGDGAFTYPEFWPTYPPENWEGLPNAGSQFALWIYRALKALEA